MTLHLQLRLALFPAAMLLLIFGSGCNQGPVEAASAGSLPGVRIPVGPIPGPGSEELHLPVNPYTGNSVALHEGRRLFQWYNCAGCHGGHGGGGMGPSLRDPVWRYGNSDAHIFASIAEGRGEGMPAWGTRVPEDQIWKLVAYIKTLRTPQEVDPPIVPPQPKVKEASK